jgi:glutamate dehydrogenase
MMDWAASTSSRFRLNKVEELNISVAHARDRGADKWWKSFTTGKTAATLGGIPHDAYGMTSISIRQYLLGIYKQLGLHEKDVTKVQSLQTGGPDGDLGSSMCLIFHLPCDGEC